MLSILYEGGEMSAVRVYEVYISKYGNRHRESVYRDLETLLNAGLVKKKYKEREKELVYFLTWREVRFDISNASVRCIPAEKNNQVGQGSMYGKD